MRRFLILTFFALTCSLLPAQITDIMSDTWVATDGLGRIMPTAKEAGALKTDKKRTVGIFYITWHTTDNHNGKPYTGDVSKVLAADDSARFDMNRPSWKDQMLHWGEPEYGYFLSKDEYVIRHDISMLSDAGVDVMILDVTNAALYWDEWNTIFKIMHRMKAEGNNVPKFCFWAYNGNVYDVVQQLYDTYYKPSLYRDLWFYWNGKPLLLYNAKPQRQDSNGAMPDYKNSKYDADAKSNPDNPHYGDPNYCEEIYSDYSPEIYSFFTLRNMWWGYYKWDGKPYVGTEDNWCFGYDLHDEPVKALSPQQLATPHQGHNEQMAVTPAQHPISNVGKSWQRKYGEPELGKGDMPKRTYVPWLGKEVDNPTPYGIYFQERWDEALKVDPDFLYLNDWNEWSAGRWPFKVSFLGRNLPLVFVDQYNAEFNRTIAPVKDKTYGDNYYMQMVQNIRRYKGVRNIPENKGISNFTIDGDFEKWNKIPTLYYDTKGDIVHRDYDGYGDFHYTNSTGRNDIISSQVAISEDNVLFHVQTAGKLTPHSDKNWMLLLIDADNNSETGWYGYDYIVNKRILSEKLSTLMRWNGRKWVQVCNINYYYDNNQLEVTIPRKSMKLQGKDSITFDFKWCDNPQSLTDPLSLCTDGDAAPNRRFNYRMIWNK